MTADPDCLCLIDGSGYIFRAFYALPPMHREDGTPTNAVYGFTAMMLNLLQENTCQNLVVVFDAKRKNFRNEFYADYKANRKEIPPDLIPQFHLIRQACDALNVPWIEQEGYEADDLIATYTKLAKEKRLTARVISADKDLMQLINDNTTMYDPMKKKEITADEVVKKFGVLPSQVVDVQALMGDSTDNIPGAKGIGPKTATQLIQQFKNIENLYQSLSQLKPSKQLDNLTQSKEDVFISKKLAALCFDAPVNRDLECFKRRPLDIDKITLFLQENNFPSLMKRLPSFQQDKVAQNLSVYQIKKPQEIHQFFSKTNEFSFTLGLDKSGEIDTIQLSDGEKAFIIKSENSSPQIDLFSSTSESISPEMWQELKKLFESPKTKIGFDIKTQKHLLQKKAIQFQLPYHDCMLMEYLLNGNKNLNSIDTFLSTQNFLGALSPENHSFFLFQAYQRLTKSLEEENLFSLYEKMDLPLIDFLFQMEENGILIDREKIKKLNTEFELKINQLSEEIYSESQEQFNINSPQQLGKILFEKRHLMGGKKGASGHWTTDVKVLEKLAEENGDKLAELVLKYRGLSKLKSTYINDFIERSESSPRIHTTFSMVATNTGRLASSNPNLQNIPIRSDEGKEIRQAFVAGSGNVLLSADYSQIELRLIAHLAQVKKLQESFIHNEDIHARTASQILGLPLEQITPDQRRSAKAVNFGIIYGISGFGLARNLHIEQNEANNYIRAYFEQYPEIKAYMEKTEKFVDEHGYVLTPFGRKIYIEGLSDSTTRQFAHRAAINAPIQGGAADIMKLAMNKINQALKESSLHALPLLQVHDELIFEVPEAEASLLAKLVKDQMESVVQLSVPLIAETGIAPNWKDAH